MSFEAGPDGRINGMPVDRAYWANTVRCCSMSRDVEAVVDHILAHLREHGWANAWHSGAAVAGAHCFCARCAPSVRSFV